MEANGVQGLKRKHVPNIVWYYLYNEFPNQVKLSDSFFDEGHSQLLLHGTEIQWKKKKKVFPLDIRGHIDKDFTSLVLVESRYEMKEHLSKA